MIATILSAVKRAFGIQPHLSYTARLAVCDTIIDAAIRDSRGRRNPMMFACRTKCGRTYRLKPRAGR